MANLSNINNKFLFTDGDFLKIGNLAPINNISGTESGISITNSNVASITLDNTAASGKRYIMYSGGNGSLVFWDGDAAVARLQIDTSGNATFTGSVTGTSANFSSIVYSSGFRNSSTNSSYNLFTRNNTGNTIFVQAAQSNANQPIAKFSYGSATVNAGTAVLQVSKDNSHFVNCDVGIGTTSPQAKLHINPITTDEIAIAINGTQNYSAGQFQRIAAGDASSLNRLAIGFGYDNPTDWSIRYSSYGRHEFYTGNDWGNAANTEKMVITSSGNVGIGTDNPQSKLHVKSSESGASAPWTNADNLVIEDSGNAGLAFQTPNTGAATIAFQDPESVQAGFIQYLHADNALRFATNGNNERMRIDSSGNSNFYGTIKSFSTGAAHLILNGDTNNSGDQGEVDAIIDLLGDGNPGIYGYRINTENWSGQTALNFQEYLNGSYTSRLFISKDGNIGINSTNPGAKLEVVDGNNYAQVGDIQGNSTMSLRMADNSLFPVEVQAYGGELRFNTTTTSGGTPSVKMTMLSSGNVGIGNTNPGAKLVVGSNAHSNATGIEVSAGSSGANIIARDGADNHNWFPYTDGNNYYSASAHVFRAGIGNSPNYMTITNTGAISLGTSATAYGAAGEVLTSNGNASPSWQAAGGGGAWTTTGNDIYNSNSGSVGIKNTSPSSLPADSNQLVVGSGVNTGSHGSANVGITIFTANSTFPYSDYARLLFTHSTSSGIGYLFEYLNRDNSSYSDSEPSLTIKHDNDKFIGITNQTNNTGLTKIVLDPNYFNSSLTQGSLHRAMFTIPVRSGVNNPGMHIYGDSQGNSNPFVGFTSTSSSSSITTKFIRFYHNSTLCGTIQKRFNANEVQYLTTSDYRLKEDLKPFKALDTICKIKVYNYKWNNIEVDNVNYGVLAHELQELIPEVVAGEKDEVNKNGEKEYQSVDYSKLVPHLIQSIQELKADNDSLKARIETLENK